MSRISFVPTPIGNLGDITYRAVETLGESDIVFAEDTRTALALLSHLEISVKVESLHKDNEKHAAGRLISEYEAGKNISVISEAGTPCISDPGAHLARRLIEENIPFEALPGATAFVPALTLSGFNSERFMFIGFPDNSRQKKRKQFEELKTIPATLIFYESPHRVKDTLAVMLEVFGSPVCAAREITKMFEETVFINDADDIEGLTVKGEFVLLYDNSDFEANTSSYDYTKIINGLKADGFSRKDCVKILKTLGLKRNEAYGLVEEIVD